jgi:hypothetical protein
MMTKLKVGHLHGYHPYAEVEPVQPYPRIDPQQSRDEEQRRQSSGRGERDDFVQRRFWAMRQLIERLKSEAKIVRVDYAQAATELTEQGLILAERNLVEQLLEFKLAPREIEALMQQIRQGEVLPELQAGPPLRAERELFPIFEAGMSEYNLCLQALQLDPSAAVLQLGAEGETEGRLVREKGRLRFDFQLLPAAAKGRSPLLTIEILVAASEIDDNGRRAILYQRPDGNYLLYADKRIDLSI